MQERPVPSGIIIKRICNWSPEQRDLRNQARGMCAATAQRGGTLLYRGKRKLTCNSNTRSSAVCTCTLNELSVHARTKAFIFCILDSLRLNVFNWSWWSRTRARRDIIYLYGRDIVLTLWTWSRTFAYISSRHLYRWSRFIQETRIELVSRWAHRDVICRRSLTSVSPGTNRSLKCSS